MQWAASYSDATRSYIYIYIHADKEEPSAIAASQKNVCDLLLYICFASCLSRDSYYNSVLGERTFPSRVAKKKRKIFGVIALGPDNSPVFLQIFLVVLVRKCVSSSFITL